MAHARGCVLCAVRCVVYVPCWTLQRTCVSCNRAAGVSNALAAVLCAAQIADALRKELVEAQKALSEMRARLAAALTEQHKSEVGDISAAEERCDELELKLDEYQVQRRAAQCNVVQLLCTQWRCQRGRIRRPCRVDTAVWWSSQSLVTLTWAFAHCGVRSTLRD